MKQFIFTTCCYLIFTISSFSQALTEKELDDEIYTVVETMPEFPGGETNLRQFLATNLKYPKEDKKSGYSGKVVIEFIVDKNGDVKNHRIAKSSGSETLDAEAMRVIKMMPSWTPGKVGEEPVIVRYMLPIIFTLK